MEIPAELFPSTDVSEALELVEKRWDFTHRLPLPRKDWNVKCPCCGAKRSQGAIQIRKWHRQFHEGHGHPWRCDVGFKCVACSLIWTHDVLLPRDAWERIPGAPAIIHWRVGLQILRGEGRWKDGA